MSEWVCGPGLMERFSLVAWERLELGSETDSERKAPGKRGYPHNPKAVAPIRSTLVNLYPTFIVTSLTCKESRCIRGHDYRLPFNNTDASVKLVVCMYFTSRLDRSYIAIFVDITG